ncbi:MAG: metallophosphoesterase family protein [Verrucomicrobiaceae bacterium]
MKVGRTLAIGDVHGSLKALKKLLKWVDPQEEDRIIMLGDYVDRGKKSKKVIDYLLKWKWSAELITLKGNHELIMDHARLSPVHLKYWKEVGGGATLKSYGGSLDLVPPEHWEFIRGGRYFYETEDFIYVHGGLEPHLPPEDQDQEEMCWWRFPDARPHFSGKTVVCGHTVQRNGKPKDKGHSICIDTAACRGGWLTCLDASRGRFWQTNQKGEFRNGKLPRRHRKMRKNPDGKVH